MEKEKITRYTGDYSFLMDLAMESARKGRVDRAQTVIHYMMEKWPERVIRREGSVLAEEVKPFINQASNP